MSDLSDGTIARFVSATNCSQETARFYLEMCNGDFNQAIQHYNESGVTTLFTFPSSKHLTLLPEPQEDNPVEPPQQAPAGHQAPVVHGQGAGLIRGVFRLCAGLLFLPINVVRASFHVCRLVIGHSLTTTAHLLLPTAVQNRFLATNGNLDPGLQAADFISSFRRRYGSQHPQFVELSWKDAAREAENQSKFLFAYIHSSEHEDTDDFCRHVLTSSDVIGFLNQHFVCWGGSIDRSSAFVLAASLGATSFPFMCLLSYTGSQATIVTSIQGKITGMNLMSILQQALDEQGAVMVERRAVRHQRVNILAELVLQQSVCVKEVDRQIREDQDMEYQRALEADRERDRQNREAAAAAEAEQEAMRQQKEQEELAKEQEVQRRLHKEENIRQRKLAKKTNLAEEPDAGPGVAQIRVKLPDGSTYNRRFFESSKVEEVYDFVDGLENLNSWDYTLVSSFPRLEFGVDTRTQSLRDLGIDHSVMLLVQSHDD